jgi:hypothetical protein
VLPRALLFSLFVVPFLMCVPVIACCGVVTLQNVVLILGCYRSGSNLVGFCYQARPVRSITGVVTGPIPTSFVNPENASNKESTLGMLTLPATAETRQGFRLKLGTVNLTTVRGPRAMATLQSCSTNDNELSPPQPHSYAHHDHQHA